MIDFHCHLLPNLDDGPAHIDNSVAMAAALRDAGFTKVYCTPHLIKGSFEATNQAVKTSVATLQTRLAQENINIELLPGREYYLDEYLIGYLKDPLFLGDTRYVMIEIPSHASAEMVKDTLFRIKCGKMNPMIAHPERCSLFATAPKSGESFLQRFSRGREKVTGAKPQDPGLLEYVRELGCSFQGNLRSFEGWYGPDVKRTAKQFRENGVFTHYGTDAHTVRGIINLPDIKKYLCR